MKNRKNQERGDGFESAHHQLDTLRDNLPPPCPHASAAFPKWPARLQTADESTGGAGPGKNMPVCRLQAHTVIIKTNTDCGPGRAGSWRCVDVAVPRAACQARSPHSCIHTHSRKLHVRSPLRVGQSPLQASSVGMGELPTRPWAVWHSRAGLSEGAKEPGDTHIQHTVLLCELNEARQ